MKSVNYWKNRCSKVEALLISSLFCNVIGAIFIFEQNKKDATTKAQEAGAGDTKFQNNQIDYYYQRDSLRKPIIIPK